MNCSCPRESENLGACPVAERIAWYPPFDSPADEAAGIAHHKPADAIGVIFTVTSETIRRQSSDLVHFFPITKNAALASCLASKSRIFGVPSASGPSSIVSQTARSVW
jgi:hypothetical protein